MAVNTEQTVNNRMVAWRRLMAAAVLMACAAPAFAQWVWTPQTGRFVNIGRLPKETPELQVEHARSLMLDGELREAWRETNKFTTFYGDTDYADDNQFLRGEIRLRQGRYKSAAEEFQSVVANYPESPYFEDVIEMQYEIGDRYYQRGLENMDKRWRLFRKRPFRQAIDVYTMVIDNQPFTEAAAEAQYKVGLCHFTREEYIEAAFEYRRVIEDYSTSEWVDEASYGLANTYYESSLPPEYDQTPSQLTIEAVDLFQARFPGDARNEQLGEWRSEMVDRIAEQKLQIAQFYESRREFDAAEISYEVVVEQFPTTPAGEEAAQWLADYREGGAEAVAESNDEDDS